MVVPFMTIYATQRLGFSITQAGIVMALFGAGSIAGAYAGGKMSDRVGFQTVQVAALFGGGAMFILVGYLTSFYSLCLGVFLLSVINESFRPANSSAIAYYSKPENRTRSYSLNRLAINLGWAFGGTIGGFLAAHNYHLLFWVDGLTNIGAGILLMIVLPMPRSVRQEIKQQKHENRHLVTSAFNDVSYRWFIFLTVLFAFCFFQMFTILPIYYRTQLHISEEQIGLLMAINGLIIAFVEMVLVYRLERSAKPYKNITYGVWLIGIAFGLFNLLSGQFMIALIAMITITVGEMLAMPFMNTYWISRSNDYNRGDYAALYTMAWGAAQIASPSLGGYIADHLGFRVLWWIIFSIAIIAGFGYYRLMHGKGIFTIRKPGFFNFGNYSRSRIK